MHYAKIKIVMNKCHGGFSLSPLAGERLIERGWRVRPYGESEDPKTLHSVDKHSYYLGDRVPRWDPDLIAVVEELGSKAASGMCAQLQVETISLDLQIEEHDGKELQVRAYTF